MVYDVAQRMIDALQAREAADAQARRLAPPGLAPEFLGEAIWHRTLAEGEAPSDAEVVEYLARCASDHVPVSGRQEYQPAIQPIEVYRVDGRKIVIRRRGRSDYVAELAGTSERLVSARTRTKVHRLVEDRHPGGAWSAELAGRDVAAIRSRWGS